MASEKIISDFIEEISMGPFGSDITVDNYVSNGVPVLNGSNISGYKLTEESFNYVSEDKAKSFRKAIARRGDVVITHRGTLGQIAYIPEDSKYDKYVISQSQFRIRFNQFIDPRYLVYLFHTDYGRKKLLSFKNHVGVPALAQATTNFRNLKIAIHDFEEQRTIADYISNIQGKIELNNRINAELEAMAKTIYDYWFVQFDFPYDFAQGRPDKNGRRTEPAEVKPYKSSGGKMVWNEELKREVPEGWGVKELIDIANITMGQSPPGESYNEIGEGVLFYQGCTDFGSRFPSIRQYTTKPSRFAKQGDILLSVRAPVGTMNISITECCIGRGLAALNSKDNCTPFLFEVLRNLKQVFDRRNTDGTTFGAITKDDLFSLKVVKPTEELLKEFSSIFTPVFEKQNVIALENQQLSSLRDWLLPMLMNGQVRVK